MNGRGAGGGAAADGGWKRVFDSPVSRFVCCCLFVGVRVRCWRRWSCVSRSAEQEEDARRRQRRQERRASARVDHWRCVVRWDVSLRGTGAEMNGAMETLFSAQLLLCAALGRSIGRARTAAGLATTPHLPHTRMHFAGGFACTVCCSCCVVRFRPCMTVRRVPAVAVPLPVTPAFACACTRREQTMGGHTAAMGIRAKANEATHIRTNDAHTPLFPTARTRRGAARLSSPAEIRHDRRATAHAGRAETRQRDGRHAIIRFRVCRHRSHGSALPLHSTAAHRQPCAVRPLLSCAPSRSLCSASFTASCALLPSSPSDPSDRRHLLPACGCGCVARGRACCSWP